MISKGFCCLDRRERGEERGDLEVAREEVVEYRDKDLPCRATGSYPGMVSLWSMLMRKGDNSTRGDPCFTRSVHVALILLFWPRCRGEEEGVAEPSGRCGFHGEGSEIRRGLCWSMPS
jgi:hypothetical protein